MSAPSSTPARDKIKIAVQVVAGVSIFMALLFVPAGHIDWVMGWVFFIAYMGGTLIGVAMLSKANPELVEERRQVKEGTKKWDQVLTNLFSLLTLPAVLIVSGLNERFGWPPRVALPIQIAALVVAALGFILVFWSMLSNPFFATYVRIQEDRGHRVASGGPYRVVRHPGYGGMIISTLATPVMLGSLWGLIPAGVGMGIMIARTTLEDRTLQNELAGYREYAAQVRYRLLPGIW
jgi:protein-S-isoprenylcysteine O-methyltransferase Ste14